MHARTASRTFMHDLLVLPLLIVSFSLKHHLKSVLYILPLEHIQTSHSLFLYATFYNFSYAIHMSTSLQKSNN